MNFKIDQAIRQVKGLLLLIILHTGAYSNGFYRTNVEITNEINIYCGNNEKAYDLIRNSIERCGITLKKVDKLDKNNKKLHIIFDAFNIPFEYFPTYYIAYQTLDLDEVPLTKSYFKKLEHAIAIWDSSWKNIGKYSLLLDNYCYFSEELIDPLMLPCLIPVDSLFNYKEILRYSNAKDTDISSHLPALFAHCMIKKPKLVIEVGVRGGESTRAFKNALDFFDVKLIGVDINATSAYVYKKLNIKNAEFKIMDDLDFSAWWDKSAYREMKADIIFIDTSHCYGHTIKELEIFVPLLEAKGTLVFHDTNMCPLPNATYQRINNTRGTGWDNKKGVIRAIKDFFSMSFNEEEYTSLHFSSKDSNWTLLHYPYCNGLTLITRLD